MHILFAKFPMKSMTSVFLLCNESKSDQVYFGVQVFLTICTQNFLITDRS